jgi:hypothetical protein
MSGVQTADKLVSDVLRKLTSGKETLFDVQDCVDELGDFSRISIGLRDLEPIHNEREIARADARSHVFQSLKAFCLYLSRESKLEHSVVLADVSSSKITAVLDEDEEGDRETISFSATPHPLFAPWAALLNKPIRVLDFALHVMQHRSSVLEPDGRELALMFSQIKASKNITKRVGIGSKSLNGVMVELQIGSEKHSAEVDLPESITISAPIYLDTEPVEIVLDLLVTESQQGDLVVFLTASVLEQTRLDVFNSMVGRIEEETGLIVGLGVISHRPWKLV